MEGISLQSFNIWSSGLGEIVDTLPDGRTHARLRGWATDNGTSQKLTMRTFSSGELKM